MSDEITLQDGVPADQRPQAAQLYCEALQQKITPLLGPVARATRFLAPGMVSERAITALHQGAVVGIAGFKLQNRGLFEPGLAAIFREYGLSAPLRLTGLALLERAEQPGVLLMDGIAVDASMRGRGIGSRLLNAIEDRARREACRAVRLDVIDTNARARALYERLGYREIRTEDIGPLRHLFHFRTATQMQKPLT